MGFSPSVRRWRQAAGRRLGLGEALGSWAASEAEEASRGEWRSSTLALDRSTRGGARSWAEREAGRGGVRPPLDAG